MDDCIKNTSQTNQQGKYLNQLTAREHISERDEKEVIKIGIDSDIAIQIDQGTFYQSKHKDEPQQLIQHSENYSGQKVEPLSQVESDAILFDLNLKIDKGPFISIVGDVGSEKSSLIDYAMQDPTLFEGSLRDNIDQLQQKTDQEINNAITKCCLGDLIQSRNGLETHIKDHGDKLSAGEKQLVCIARAVLKKSQIVLIDEATANIDIDTEHKIQETIQNAFKECTVITIAHRINTILHCDKILVLDKGQVKEFGFTKEPLNQTDSLVYGIYQEALKVQNIEVKLLILIQKHIILVICILQIIVSPLIGKMLIFNFEIIIMFYKIYISQQIIDLVQYL